jgi:DNA invertase Pin-like site-specific DNA recombinase
MLKKAAILARCSSEANVCNQVLLLRQQAQGMYIVNEDDVYGDQIGGSSPIDERPELKRLMQNIEEGKKQYDTVLVQDSTRLGKSPEQVRDILNWFAAKNITVQFYEGKNGLY